MDNLSTTNTLLIFADILLLLILILVVSRNT